MSDSVERDVAWFATCVIGGGVVALFMGFGLLPLIVGGLAIWGVARFAALLTKR